MVNDIIAQSTANVNSQPQKIYKPAIFHVKQEAEEYFTSRFMDAWHRLDRKGLRRVKQLQLARMLAGRMGGTVSPNTVKGWEQGAIPDVETIAAIAELCGVHPSWLAFGLGGPDDPIVGVVRVRPPNAKRSPQAVVQPGRRGKLISGKDAKTATGKGQ